MAVINNNDMRKRKLYKKNLEKRYNFAELDNELKSWDARTKSNKSRLDIWKEEEEKVTKQFNDEMAKEKADFYSQFEKEKQLFEQNPNNVQSDKLKDMEGNWLRQEDENNRVFKSKIDAFYGELKSEAITLKNLEDERKAKEAAMGISTTTTGNTSPVGSTGDIVNSTIDNSAIISPTNDNATGESTTASKNNNTNTTNLLIEDGNDGNATNTVDNKTIIEDDKGTSSSTTLPLIGIIVVAIVAVTCAAFFVIRKRRKTRQFKADFEMKPSYESSDIHIVTDNPRVITEDFINDYATDPQPAEESKKVYEEYGKAYGNDQQVKSPPPIPSYSPNFNSLPESPKSQGLSTTPRELTIDDIIPLISPKAMKAPISKALDSSQ